MKDRHGIGSNDSLNAAFSVGRFVRYALGLLAIAALGTAVPVAAVCVPIDLGSAAYVSEFGDTSEGSNDVGGSACGPVAGSGGDAAPDAVYQWTAPAAGFYVIRAQTFTTGFEVLLSVRDESCTGTELACNSNFPGVPLGAAALLVSLAEDQTVAIVVDGTDTQGGSYQLNIWLEYQPCLGVILPGRVAYTEATSSTYPPSSPACVMGAADVQLAETQAPAGTFTTREALLTWDTSVLPPDTVVSSILRPGAQLSMNIFSVTDADSQHFVGEWVEWDGTCDAGQYGPPVLSEAFSRPLASLLPFTLQEFTLEEYATHLNLAGDTGLRLRVTGGQPSGTNEVSFAGDLHLVYGPPALLLSVCYPEFFPTPTPTGTPTPTPTATPTATPPPAPGCCAFSGANPFGGTCLDNVFLSANGGGLGPVSLEACQFISQNFLNGDPVLHFNPNSYCSPNAGDTSGVCPPPPAPPVAEKIIAWGLTGGQITLTGTTGSVGGGNDVKIINTRTGQEVFATANADGSFAAVIAVLERDVLIVQARDGAAQ